MPHMHDEQTGEFQPLPDNVMQVESGLEVSFQRNRKPDRSLSPRGVVWACRATTTVAACEMASEEGHDDTERYVKHTMIVRAQNPMKPNLQK